MADAQKYTAGETLCRVLNAGEDALKVDIDNVTLTTEGSDIAIEVHLDKAEDSVLMFSHTVASGSGGTSLVPLVDSAGHLQVDTLSSALPTGAATAANQATIIGHVDGVETLLTAANADHAANEALLTTIDADTNAIKVDMAAIEVLITTLDGVQDSALTKLGEIETTNNANQVLLGTIDSDTDAIKTDIAALEVLSTAANADLAEIEVATEATQSSLEKMLYGNALVITAIHGSGSTQSLGATYEALYVGVGGDVVVTMVGTGNFTFKNVASGQLLPIRITHVVNTNTTATNMIALKA